MFRNVSHQKSLLKIWEMRLVMLICYISLTIELFNISVKNRNWSCFFLPVICDIFYIIHMYGKFYTGYFNKYGLLVMDSALIRRRYRQTELKLDLLSVLPFEIISLIFINTSYQLDIYNYMKLNRLLRIYFICRYFGVRSRLLNINVYWTRTLYVVMWITLMVQVTSAP